MDGTVSVVLERILSTQVIPTHDDVLQTHITLSLKELLAISPAISDSLLRSFQEDEAPHYVHQLILLYQSFLRQPVPHHLYTQLVLHV